MTSTQFSSFLFACVGCVVRGCYPVAREVLCTLRVTCTLRVNFHNVQIPSQNIGRHSMRMKINPFPLFDPIAKTLSTHGNPIVRWNRRSGKWIVGSGSGVDWIGAGTLATERPWRVGADQRPSDSSARRQSMIGHKPNSSLSPSALSRSLDTVCSGVALADAVSMVDVNGGFLDDPRRRRI